MLARKRQSKPILADTAKDAHNGTLRPEIHTARPHRNASTHDALHILLCHSFRAVMGERMSHFMAHNHGKAIFIFRDWNETRIDRRITARQSKGIGLV